MRACVRRGLRSVSLWRSLRFIEGEGETLGGEETAGSLPQWLLRGVEILQEELKDLTGALRARLSAQHEAAFDEPLLDFASLLPEAASHAEGETPSLRRQHEALMRAAAALLSEDKEPNLEEPSALQTARALFRLAKFLRRASDSLQGVAGRVVALPVWWASLLLPLKTGCVERLPQIVLLRPPSAPSADSDLASRSSLGGFCQTDDHAASSSGRHGAFSRPPSLALQRDALGLEGVEEEAAFVDFSQVRGSSTGRAAATERKRRRPSPRGKGLRV